MPVVTALEKASGRLGGFLLEVDGAEPFRVSEDLCRSRRIRVGTRLADGELREIAATAGAAEAFDRAVRYLSYRPRTCREVARYLGKHGLTQHADGAIARCLELGYLDDESYAHAFVRERVRLKPRGRHRLVSELLGRGVARDTAERAVVRVMDEEGVTETFLLREVAVGRIRSLRNLDPASARRRLAAYLARRGFPARSIREVVREMLPDDPSGRSA